MARPLPKSAYLNVRFASAVEQFGIELKNTASISHKGNRGTAREQLLRDFFARNMPDRFAVTHGEAVDLSGRTSQQFDLVIYDKISNFPFSSEGVTILPAEAVLATVEIKSKLDSKEVRKSVEAAVKLRSLRPFDRSLGGINVGSNVGRSYQCRYHHSLFAYQTNLKEDDWGNKELERLTKTHPGTHLIDCVYVLDRGIINVPAKLCRLEDNIGGAISSFYFSILNFVIRESSRRSTAPYNSYITRNKNVWKKL